MLKLLLVLAAVSGPISALSSGSFFSEYCQAENIRLKTCFSEFVQRHGMGIADPQTYNDVVKSKELMLQLAADLKHASACLGPVRCGLGFLVKYVAASVDFMAQRTYVDAAECLENFDVEAETKVCGKEVGIEDENDYVEVLKKSRPLSQCLAHKMDCSTAGRNAFVASGYAAADLFETLMDVQRIIFENKKVFFDPTKYENLLE